MTPEERDIVERIFECECHCHKTAPGPDCVCTMFECKHCKEDDERKEVCETCGGSGEVTTMESVYPGTPDAHITAPIGNAPCPECRGVDDEADFSGSTNDDR